MKSNFAPFFFRVFVAVVSCVLSASHLSAGIYGDLTYIVLGDEVSITDCNTRVEGSVVIPGELEGKPVTSIGSSAFFLCNRLSGVFIPDSVTSIGDDAFRDCSRLFNASIADGVTSIGNNAFRGCTMLMHVSIPSRVTHIGDGAFYGCVRITTLSVPGGVTSIGRETFRGCTGLSNIVIPNSVNDIKEYAFYGCDDLKSINIPSGVTAIKERAFGYCGLESISIPETVTSIGDYAFYSCNDFSSISIPNSVLSVGAGAFQSCLRLTSVNIPRSITSIGEQAFGQCRNLESVLFLGDAPNAFGSDVFLEAAANFTLYHFTIRSGFTSPTWKGYPSVSVDLILSEESKDISASGGGSTFEVSCPLGWSWSADAEWLVSEEVEGQNGNRSFSYSVGPNLPLSPDEGETSARSATITFTCYDLIVTHVVNQAGSGYVLAPDGEADSPTTFSAVADSASAGKYAGFLVGSDGDSIVGYFKQIKLASSGKFSAKMYWGGVAYPLKGVLDGNGEYFTTFTTGEGELVTVNLQLVRTAEWGYKFEGVVSVGDEDSQVVAAGVGDTHAYAGAYTLLILGEEETLASHGYGLMKVTSTGSAKVKGVLGDGSKWTAKCNVTSDGEMPLYYGKRGVLGGLVRFRDVVGVSDCDAELSWRRPGSADTLTRNLVGSRYQETGARLLTGVSDGNPNVVLYAGLGELAELWNLGWTNENRINYSGDEKLKMAVKKATGQLKGKIPVGDDLWKAEGVVFQKQNLAGGLLFQPQNISRDGGGDSDAYTRSFLIIPN